MSIVWFNGALADGPLALDAADRGLTLGDGIFETIAVHGPRVIWLNEHLSRMANAATELGIGFDLSKIKTGITAVLQHNDWPSASLRITLTRGAVQPRSLTGQGANPSLMISLSQYDGSKDQSVTLATSTIRRNETAPSSRLKTLSYIDNIAAAREVTARADDALMLNTRGHVACTTIGNLFLLKGNQLITPRADQGILCGIARAKLLPEAQEAIVSLDDIFAADAVFRTNSLRLVTPVTKLDDKPLGTRSLDAIKRLILERTNI